METLKVSVVIPVYNTESYVEEAVRSIMNQTLREIEIIIIDDGSTDESPSVLHRLAGEDNRICIHTQTNKGLSEARNAGIARAQGHYLYFMDSDDLLEEDALELCYTKCKNNALDMLFFDADSFGADISNCPWFDYHRAAAHEDRIYTGRELFGAMLDRHKYIASACLYMVRREFLSQNSLAFYPHILHEDELFTTQALLCAQRTGLIVRAFFKRRLRADSIMGRRFSERNLEGYLTVFAQLTQTVRTSDQHAQHLVRRYLRYTVNPVLRNAWLLPTSTRLHTVGVMLRDYTCLIQPTAIATLLLKLPVKKLLHR